MLDGNSDQHIIFSSPKVHFNTRTWYKRIGANFLLLDDSTQWYVVSRFSFSMSKWFLPYQIGPRRPHWWSVLCVATGTSSCSSSSSPPAGWLCGVMTDLSFSFPLPPPQPPPNSAPLYTKMHSLPREWVRRLLGWFFLTFGFLQTLLRLYQDLCAKWMEQLTWWEPESLSREYPYSSPLGSCLAPCWPSVRWLVSLNGDKIQVIKVYTVHNVKRNTKFTYCLYGAWTFVNWL